MSGGAWNYQQYRIEELAEQFARGTICRGLLEMCAKLEHIADWAESNDTRQEDTFSYNSQTGEKILRIAGAKTEAYNLIVATFNELYGR